MQVEYGMDMINDDFHGRSRKAALISSWITDNNPLNGYMEFKYLIVSK